MRLTRAGAVYLALYITLIWAANAAIALFGVLPLGPLSAPAGVLFAGLSFSVRDALQDAAGRRWTVAGVLVGALLSAGLSGPLALASGAAFLLSELADLAVYTPLRARSWGWAVAASNAVGATLDSAVFLWLAFGSLAYLPGQVALKVAMVLPWLAGAWLLRRRGVAA